MSEDKLDKLIKHMESSNQMYKKIDNKFTQDENERKTYQVCLLLYCLSNLNHFFIFF